METLLNDMRISAEREASDDPMTDLDPNAAQNAGALNPSRSTRRLLAMVALLASLFFAVPLHADEHDSKSSGHPLRIVAYVVHPVGVILDTLIMRPAHWIGSFEPLKTLFGHRG